MAAPAQLAEFSSADLADARCEIPSASDETLRAFANRQSHCRLRTRQLLDFYRKYPCGIARVHMLTAPAVLLGRFWGHSPSFAAMGDLFMPVDRNGLPRTPHWARYAEACDQHLPPESRDELWLVAHMADFERVRKLGFIASLLEEAKANTDTPAWNHILSHMESTLGARLFDESALAGDSAVETAVAHSMRIAVSRLLGKQKSLVRFYLGRGFAAVFRSDRPLTSNHLSYRSAALASAKNLLLCAGMRKVWRRGLRLEQRGSDAQQAGWPMVERVLGDAADKVDPMILAFYRNPGQFQVSVSVSFHTLPAKFWSRVATLLTGQGLHDTAFEQIRARFRVYRRSDGSMHFVRELYCGDRLRIFDSDFVLREIDGRSTFFEVFPDLKTEVQMDMIPLEDGGLQIVSRNIFLRKLRLPDAGLCIDFRSHVREGKLEIQGRLLMQPRTRLGKFCAYRILRRPEELARITYFAAPLAAAAATSD